MSSGFSVVSGPTLVQLQHFQVINVHLTMSNVGKGQVLTGDPVEVYVSEGYR